MAGDKMKMPKTELQNKEQEGGVSEKRITEYVKPVAIGVLALLTNHPT